MSAEKSSPVSKSPAATTASLTSPARAAHPVAAFSFSPPPPSASSAPLSFGGATSSPLSFQATPSLSPVPLAQPQLLSPPLPGAVFAFAPPALTVPSPSSPSPATPFAFVPPNASPSAPSPSSVFVFAPPPPKASLASLPTDLLRLILSYFPFRPRLLVVSRVCKQWRTLSLSTVTRIPKTFAPSRRFLVDVLPHCANLTDFAAFTSLTTLHPQDWFKMRSFPITHLRQMNLTTFNSAEKVIAYTTWAVRLTRLTNLTLIGGDGLLGPCVSSATSLVFEVGFKGWANLNRIVNTNLRELKISRPETDNAGERTTLPLQFLLHHASQLTSLTLEGIDSVDFVKLRPAPLFPLVRELFVYVVDDEFDERPLCKLLPHVPSLTALSYPANIKSAEVWARVNPTLVQTSDMLEYPSPPCRLEDLGINFDDYKCQRPADLAAVQSTLRILNVENTSPTMLTTFAPAVWPRLTHLIIDTMTISPCDPFFEHWRFPILRKIYLELPVAQSLNICDRLFDRRDLLPRLYYVRITDFEPFPAFLCTVAFDVVKKAERFGVKHINFEGTHWQGLREYAKQRLWLDIEVDVGSNVEDDEDEDEEEEEDDDDEEEEDNEEEGEEDD